MDRSKQLGEGEVLPLLVKFSIPAIIGMMVNALYNVVDRIFVGHGVGSVGLAAITISFPLMIIMMAFAMLIGVGANTLISIRLGQQKKEEAEQIIGNAFLLLIIVSIVITVGGLFFMNPLLKLFGASEEVMPYAKEFLTIILMGGIFQNIGFGMNNFIRGEGNPKIAAATMIIGAVVNTILNPIFIFVLHLGIRGSALATVISQAVSAAWVLYYFLGGKSLLKLQRKNLKIAGSIVGSILAIGSAPFAMQLAASVLSTILNHELVTYGGDIAVAAMGTVNSLSMLILMPIFGINQGAQPIIGFNYGAHNYDRVKKTLKYATIGATVVVLLGFVVTQLFPRQLISLFGESDAALINVGARALRFFLAMLPIIGFQIVGANYFQAVGKPKQAMILSLSRQVLVLIPALLILPRFFELDGVFLAGPVADFVSSVITAIWLLWELKHLNAKHEEMQMRNAG